MICQKEKKWNYIKTKIWHDFIILSVEVSMWQQVSLGPLARIYGRRALISYTLIYAV